ncbi:MAG TPA: MFS transporter [Acidimicrobiales bacterium]|nr:MFS transporter [Acidimicrobiales bacterium]
MGGAASAAAARRGERATIAAVCLGTFLAVTNISAPNVALPSIGAALHASFGGLQWVVDAYALAMSACLLVAGSLSDRLGRRRVFLVGLVVLAAASLVCALATSMAELELARAVQGAGGAILSANSYSLLVTNVSGPRRPVAFGLLGATSGVSVASSLLGGVLTDLGGWRWVFYVDLPLATLCLALAMLMPETRGHDHPVDWVGAVLIGGSLFCVVLALVRADDDGWASGVVVGLLVGGAALALALTAWELRTRAPLLDLRLFANPACAGVSLVAFLSAMCMFGTLLYIAIYLQQGLGYGPLATGLRFLPVVVPATLLAPVTGRALRSLSPHVPLALGAALIGAGFLLMARVAPASGWESIVPGLAVAGVGLGLLNPSLSTASIAVAPRWRSGMASGTNNTFRQVGVTTGIALFGTILVGRVGDRLNGSLAGTLGPSAAARLARSLVVDGVGNAVAGAPAGQRRALAAVGRTALVTSVGDVFLLAGAVALVGALVAAVLVRPAGLAVHDAAGEGDAAVAGTLVLHGRATRPSAHREAGGPAIGPRGRSPGAPTGDGGDRPADLAGPMGPAAE